MFYDVLQQLCDKVNLLNHKNELNDTIKKNTVLSKFTTLESNTSFNVEDKIGTIMNAAEDTDA